MSVDAAEPSDGVLIGRCQSGDTVAFDELMTRYRPRIFAMTLNFIRNEADALDVAQETFIRAWRAIGRYEARSCFFTWLYRITHNLCYDRLRSRRMESAGEFDDSRGMPPTAIDANLPYRSERPDRALARAELREEIFKAMAQLTPDHRAVILLKDVQGLSYGEIASAISCSLGTVMSRLFYARRQLQGLLGNTTGTLHHD